MEKLYEKIKEKVNIYDNLEIILISWKALGNLY